MYRCIEREMQREMHRTIYTNTQSVNVLMLYRARVSCVIVSLMNFIWSMCIVCVACVRNLCTCLYCWGGRQGVCTGTVEQQARVCTYTHINTQTRRHTDAHIASMCTRPHIYLCTHTHTHTPCVCMHTSTHSHTHAHTHTHTHTEIHRILEAGGGPGQGVCSGGSQQQARGAAGQQSHVLDRLLQPRPQPRSRRHARVCPMLLFFFSL